MSGASLNPWGKFFPDKDEDHDEVFQHLAMAIKTSKRVRRYRKFLDENLTAADKELETSGNGYRLAKVVRYEYYPEAKKSVYTPKL